MRTGRPPTVRRPGGPRRTLRTVPDTPSPDPALPGPPPTVLVIDDNMDTADSLARFLRVGAGFTVKVAYDGPTGVKMAGADRPDVVVCDIAMPKLSGLRVAD